MIALLCISFRLVYRAAVTMRTDWKSPGHVRKIYDIIITGMV